MIDDESRLGRNYIVSYQKCRRNTRTRNGQKKQAPKGRGRR